jgi:K+-sensing histidine kinase KdpD
MGNVYFNFKNYKNAQTYFSQALLIQEKNHDKRGMAIASLNLGKLFIELQLFQKAKPHLDKAMKLAFEINDGELIKSACFENYCLNKSLGNTSKALEYYMLYSSQKDSILNNENTKKIAELQVQFEISKKEGEIVALKKQKEIDALKLNYQKVFLGIFLLGFGLVLIIAVQLYRNLSNNKRTNKMLERLFSVVAHDLRSPVSTLSNLSDLLNQPIADLTENERQTIIKHMDGITKSTVSLLDNLLDWSRKQQGLIGYDPEIVNVNEVLNESLMWMDMIAKNKDIQIQNEITDEVKVFVDRSALSLLFRNLIINAIKFSHSKGQIRVFFKDDNQQVIIGVEDKGVGMSSEKLNEVISGKNYKSDSGTNNEMGTGFGIRLCKEFIAINKGNLWAESIENTQTIFYFSLPKVD